MSETHKERIVKSTAARRMMEAVSPIYEDSYAGCWLFEDIGREWDRLWEIIDELPDQLFPHTATWLLSLWERRYGIVPGADDTIQVRQQRIEDIETSRKAFTPYVLDRWVNKRTGGKAIVEDNIAPYTFGITISSENGLSGLDTDELSDYIMQMKQSHMSCKVTCLTEKKTTIYTGLALYNGRSTQYTMQDNDADELYETILRDETGALLLDERALCLLDEGGSL